VHRLYNILAGLAGVFPGVVTAFGAYNMIGDFPDFETSMMRAGGSIIIIAAVNFSLPEKQLKKAFVHGLAVGFLWTLAALVFELDL
jgi:hypothetical protein